MSVCFRQGLTPGIVCNDSIGISSLPRGLLPFFDIQASSALFRPLPIPTSIDDWLAQFIETPQTFSDWKRDHPCPLSGPIVVLPIGHWVDDGPDLIIVHRYLSAFFTGSDVVVHDAVCFAAQILSPI